MGGGEAAGYDGLVERGVEEGEGEGRRGRGGAERKEGKEV